MNVSAKTEYACLAVMELAMRYGSHDPVRIGTIADLHGIPSRFLVQILLQLKGAGFVASTRGAAGGYRLIRDPDSISLADVMSVIEGQSGDLKGSAGKETASSGALLDVWNEVARVEREMLVGTTFADLIARVQGEAEHMYFI